MKTSNGYQLAFGRLYARTPKAVFAAVAFSMCFLWMEEKGTAEALERFLEEWRCLHDNGIVPQAPPKGSTDAAG